MSITLDDVIDRRLVHSVYQPIVDLFAGGVVGYEALARGPEGRLESPGALFSEARDAGRLGDLERVCRRAAVEGAAAGGLESGSTLFINLEADALEHRGEDALRDLVGATSGMRIVLELTERALTARPADLLPALRRLRDQGFGIALDDVGIDRRSLALMPLMRPDVIKLDLSLTQNRPSEYIAAVHNAVSAQAESTGAMVVAEGIETPAHAERARAMGATLGQGFMLGRPAALPTGFPHSDTVVPIDHASPRRAATPFTAVAAERPVRRGTKPLLLAISRDLERHAAALGPNAVVISTFQHVRHFNRPTRRLYQDLASYTAFVGALGEDMGTEPAYHVRGADLASDDPLAAEWDIVVVGPHFAACFAARDLGDRGPDLDRRFDFAVTYDRDLVVLAAQSLMARIAPLHAPTLPVHAHVAA